MSKLTRREFLRMLAATSGSLALQRLLTACGIEPASEPRPAWTSTGPSPANLPSATPFFPSPSNTASEAAPIPTATTVAAATPTTLPPGAPDLVVARGSDPETIVYRALAAFGGMEKFVPQDARVIIKPNICVAYNTYEYASTTNPWVVAALVKACLEAGARSVQVMDLPFGGTQEQAYSKSGIAEQVEAAGGEMVFMPGFQYVSTDIPDGVDLKKTKVFGGVLDADVLINVPIAKHHSLSGLTLGMKNLMGLIQDRPMIHQNLGQRVADLTSLFRPTLTVIDAVRILVANGPTGGRLDDVKQMDTVIVSPDIVAADSFAATLFGLSPDQIPYIPAAAAMGLGHSDWQNLKLEEITA